MAENHIDELRAALDADEPVDEERGTPWSPWKDANSDQPHEIHGVIAGFRWIPNKFAKPDENPLKPLVEVQSGKTKWTIFGDLYRLRIWMQDESPALGSETLIVYYGTKELDNGRTMHDVRARSVESDHEGWNEEYQKALSRFQRDQAAAGSVIPPFGGGQSPVVKTHFGPDEAPF